MNAEVNTGAAPARYDNLAITLHWLVALIVAGMATLGLLLDEWPKATKEFYVNIHATTGLLLFALVLLRLLWRIGHKPPELPAGTSDFNRMGSKVLHWLVYTLLVFIPVVGIVALVWHGKGFHFGLFSLEFGVKSNSPVYHFAEDFHGYLVYGLLGLLALHILAALYHQFIVKDRLLLRMMPGGR